MGPPEGSTDDSCQVRVGKTTVIEAQAVGNKRENGYILRRFFRSERRGGGGGGGGGETSGGVDHGREWWSQGSSSWNLISII